MEKRATTLEEHLSFVNSSHEKTAGNKNDNGDLLSRLASELDLPKTAAEDMGSAPYAEGEVSNADTSVAGANPETVAATEGVTGKQVALAGGNAAESAAGEMPAATKPNEGTAASAGDGKVVDGNSMHRTPEAIEAAAEGPDSDVGGDVSGAAAVTPDGASPGGSAGNMDEEKTAEAKKIGKAIADSFQEEMQKKAEDEQYSEALGILKEAGLLDGYKINDPGLEKVAEEEGPSALEKIANKEELSRQDIVKAAHELIEFEKQAEDAEAAGRADAQAAVAEEIEKEAFQNEENEKVAEYLKDPEVVKAVQLLKGKGVLK